MKVVVAVIFGLLGLGLLGFGFVESSGVNTEGRAVWPAAPMLALRPFPTSAGELMPEGAGKPADTAPTPDTPPKPDTPAVDDTPPPKPDTPPVDDTPPPKPDTPAVDDTPKPKPDKPDVADTPKPKPDKPPPDDTPKPKPDKPKPSDDDLADLPDDEPKPRPKPEGVLNLRASDTADVLVDGRKVGTSPVLGFKAKPGKHRVRFDCYDSGGNTVQGPVQVVNVQPELELDVDYDCPPSE